MGHHKAKGLIVYHQGAVLIPVSEIRVIEESVMRRGWDTPSFQLWDQTLSCNRRHFIFSLSLQVMSLPPYNVKEIHEIVPVYVWQGAGAGWKGFLDGDIYTPRSQATDFGLSMKCSVGK